jgi:hypothetical protein
VSATGGVIAVGGCSTGELLKIVEVAVGVPGVRDVKYKPREPGDPRPTFH